MKKIYCLVLCISVLFQFVAVALSDETFKPIAFKTSVGKVAREFSLAKRSFPYHFSNEAKADRLMCVVDSEECPVIVVVISAGIPNSPIEEIREPSCEVAVIKNSNSGDEELQIAKFKKVLPEKLTKNWLNNLNKILIGAPRPGATQDGILRNMEFAAWKGIESGRLLFVQPESPAGFFVQTIAEIARYVTGVSQYSNINQLQAQVDKMLRRAVGRDFSDSHTAHGITSLSFYKYIAEENGKLFQPLSINPFPSE